MAMVRRLYVGILTALALCKYCLADGNYTEGTVNRTVDHCHHHGNGENCTDAGQWNGHLSKCPEELAHYCVHGDCRYVEAQKSPSCRCHHGFTGSRCEYVDLDWRRGEKRQIIIACVITGLILLILLIVFICICSHRKYRLCGRRGRSREDPRNGSEKLSMMDTGAAHTIHTPDSTELPHTNTV